MESRTKFNLEDEVDKWKSSLSNNPNFTIDNVIELESHLLDQIEELQQIGLSEAEGYLIAQKRIGTIDVLTNEFSKVNKSVHFRNKILPYLNGGLVFLAIMTLIELLVGSSILFTSTLGLGDSYLNIIMISFFLIVSLGLSFYIYVQYHNKARYLRKIKNIPFLVAMIVSCKILTFLIVPIWTRIISTAQYGMLQMNLSVFKLLFICVLLSISCIFYYSSKREADIKLVGLK